MEIGTTELVIIVAVVQGLVATIQARVTWSANRVWRAIDNLADRVKVLELDSISMRTKCAIYHQPFQEGKPDGKT